MRRKEIGYGDALLAKDLMPYLHIYFRTEMKGLIIWGLDYRRLFLWFEIVVIIIVVIIAVTGITGIASWL